MSLKSGSFAYPAIVNLPACSEKYDTCNLALDITSFFSCDFTEAFPIKKCG